jgi:starvation-inducible outer membrane lipoprotein
MREKIVIPILSLGLMALAACSSEPDEAQTSKEHVWKSQTQAIDKAREVEGILQRKQTRENQENQ